MSILQIRLKNCLQTILDLEPEIQKNGEDSFDKEFSSLKTYLDHIDELELAEDDVIRLENVTSIFLQELAQSNYVFARRAKVVQ